MSQLEKAQMFHWQLHNQKIAEMAEKLRCQRLLRSSKFLNFLSNAIFCCKKPLLNQPNSKSLFLYLLQ
jgi:hypothetical protein